MATITFQGYNKIPFDINFIARGGATEVLKGDLEPGRMVILEFPNKEQAKQWGSSTEYAPARRMRQGASVTKMILVEGVEPV